MKIATFLVIVLLSLTGDKPPKRYNWIFTGTESCRFNGVYDPPLYVPCEHFYRELGYDNHTGKSISEWGFMWKRGSREVHYIPRTGMVGLGDFSIGEIYDTEYNDREKMENAVSYSEDRESIVIGVVNDGYTFYANSKK